MGASIRRFSAMKILGTGTRLEHLVVKTGIYLTASNRNRNLITELGFETF